ncbi:protein kinase domain-containing protein [uncultured Anoxybacillus sp.]|uniref:protein kinase domain-containing protein n=1 Tax=uncultured Anoxybacillus sp. TaxID=263860 RepID=UPI00262342DE|nr:protein kinase [uncultured Anoxybacillus sp.]
MLSDITLRFISEVFIGDKENCYKYKQGSALVNFFNEFFGFHDVYQSGFPSRWAYVLDKIKELHRIGDLNEFFSLILSKEYIILDNRLTEVEAIERRAKILDVFNRQLRHDKYQLVQKDETITLIKTNENLVLIGRGGFADVYYRKSDGRVIKKLKDENMFDRDKRSRFKREYEIIKNLQSIHGVIKVYEFREDELCYEMEKADCTLLDYVENNFISEEEKLGMVFQLMQIMSKIHSRNVVHRDLSPSNILFVKGVMKIADFGLGKDFRVLHSYQTINTNNYGQYDYCAPEQIRKLQVGDKRSDVFSLGKIINFIFTKKSWDSRHIMKPVAEKATMENGDDRYESAISMLEDVNRMVAINKNRELKETVEKHIAERILTIEVIKYIDQLNGEKLCRNVMSNQNFRDILIKYMKTHSTHESEIITKIHDHFEDVCGTYESHDPFATFAYLVLSDRFGFVTNQKAAYILSYIAHSVNRFYAQRLINELIEKGVEPFIEEILRE